MRRRPSNRNPDKALGGAHEQATEPLTTARWWQVALAGIGVLIAAIGFVNIVGEIPEGLWAPVMLTFLSGVVTTAAGLILGIAHLSANAVGSSQI